MAGGPSPSRKTNCRQCRYYYITWEPKTPHGCRAMGFKSQSLPSTVVWRSSGRECQAYVPKPAPAK